MRKAFLILAWAWLSAMAGAQNIPVTFICTGEFQVIDSVQITATNLTTNQSVTFRGHETLILNAQAGVEEPGVHFLKSVLYPNPSAEKFFMDVSLSGPEPVDLAHTDLNGRKVADGSFDLSPGMHRFAITLSQCGTFLIAVRQESGLAYHKLVNSAPFNGDNRISYQGVSASNPSPEYSLKMEASSPVLGFNWGDIVHYSCQAEDFRTILCDAPQNSNPRQLEIGFHTCRDRDGQNYAVVKIGNQVWMAENLRYLPAVHSLLDNSSEYPRYHVYGYVGTEMAEAKGLKNYLDYGVLYNFPAARISCPVGWHLPTRGEYDVLNTILGFLAGVKMKEPGTIHWNNPNPYATNESGFTGRAGGYYSGYEYFDLGYMTYFWTATEDDEWSSWCKSLWVINMGLEEGCNLNRGGFSVRCLKN